MTRWNNTDFDNLPHIKRLIDKYHIYTWRYSLKKRIKLSNDSQMLIVELRSLYITYNLLQVNYNGLLDCSELQSRKLLQNLTYDI